MRSMPIDSMQLWISRSLPFSSPLHPDTLYLSDKLRLSGVLCALVKWILFRDYFTNTYPDSDFLGWGYRDTAHRSPHTKHTHCVEWRSEHGNCQFMHTIWVYFRSRNVVICSAHFNCMRSPSSISCLRPRTQNMRSWAKHLECVHTLWVRMAHTQLFDTHRAHIRSYQAIVTITKRMSLNETGEIHPLTWLHPNCNGYTQWNDGIGWRALSRRR